ncbi:MAG: tRNA (adenosine(37)-N6)-threonylcarbamoyltransferase complex dimerization subunit type 1 TsaB [Gammaproteobacteria bacterium]|nr:tRNA (adenosine(37)-N6)-threonylcarbamoyltransferase complex dimerization subunit type 1 TsaB [Gammaproteobacteria bacterium]
MKLLAFDTSSLACTAALQIGTAVTVRHEEQAREHTRLLLPMLRELLRESDVQPADLDAIVLGNGPGSFIGMRIAASVAQGLAFGSGIPVVPVSSLAAVALQVISESPAEQVVVTQDAHMDEVYLAAFRRAGARDIEVVIDEQLHAVAPIEALDTENAQNRVAAGAGWQRYPKLLNLNGDRLGDQAGVLHPNAQYLLPLGAAALAAGRSIKARDLNPAYLRQKVAQKPAARP